MNTTSWLTSTSHGTSEGQLGVICLRLLGIWGVFSAPLLAIAALCLISVAAEWQCVGIVALMVCVAWYGHLVLQGSRVFAAAQEKDMSSLVFSVVELALYACAVVPIVLHGYRQEWAIIGLVAGSAVAFLQVTYTAIALLARQRVPLVMLFELLLSYILLSSLLTRYYREAFDERNTP